MSQPESVERLSRARLKLLRQLRTAKGRREQRSFLLDGSKLVRDALAANVPITELLSVSPSDWLDAGPPVIGISRADAERLSDTRTPQGHFALVRDDLAEFESPVGDHWHVAALDSIQNPGNVGGIIRSAAAFKLSAVIVGPASADPTHPRTLRASAGAFFQIPVARSLDLAADLRTVRDQGASVIAADQAGVSLQHFSIPDRAAWIFGNEGAGVDLSLAELIDHRVAVPISDSIESLNVNVAAGVVFHHIRQLSA